MLCLAVPDCAVLWAKLPILRFFHPFLHKGLNVLVVHHSLILVSANRKYFHSFTRCTRSIRERVKSNGNILWKQLDGATDNETMTTSMMTTTANCVTLCSFALTLTRSRHASESERKRESLARTKHVSNTRKLYFWKLKMWNTTRHRVVNITLSHEWKSRNVRASNLCIFIPVLACRNFGGWKICFILLP